MDVNSDNAYNFIRKRILSGEYRPGQALMPKALSTEIGLSPTPVRDALRQLESDGLVTILPRLGAKVNTMSVKGFRELCELRLVLETHMAGLAALRRNDADLQDLAQAVDEMQMITENTITAEGEEQLALVSRLAHADIQFHIAVMTAAKNDLIKKEILRLHLINRVVSSENPGMRLPGGQDERPAWNAHLRDVVAEHKEILDAIRRQDEAAARSAMHRSLQYVLDRTIREMARAERESLARDLVEQNF